MVGRAVAVALVAVAITPGVAWAQGDTRDDGGAGPDDYDVRTGAIAPTTEQRALAEAAGGQVSWNRFGTPSSLIRPGGYVDARVAGDSAVAAARTWLRENRRLFRLSSIEGLELHNDSQLARGAGHAVTFKQTFDGVDAGGGGLVTVGVSRNGDAWRVASVSSTLTADEELTGSAGVAPERAWARAAANVGVRRSLAQIDAVNAGKRRLPGWELLDVQALPDLQRVREVAFPTLRDGVVPAYEALVLDTERPEPLAAQLFVDARDLSVLARQSLVDHSHEGPPPVFQFEGALPPADGACDVRKGPYVVTAGAHIRAIDVFAGADAPLQDIVLRLYAGTTLVAQADTLTTPERIRYAPAGGPAPGEYFVEVCEFRDGSPTLTPPTYRGTVTLDNTAAPSPFLARWSVFPANPPLATLGADPWNHPDTDTRERWCWRASAADCDRVIANLASRSPWDHDVRSGFSTSTTIGNNAITAESWTNPSAPGPTQFRPVSATRDYTYPWANAWNNADCDPGTPYGSAFVPGQSFDVSAAVTNLFAMHNRMHDFSYLLGFTEENWNAQQDNLGLTEPSRANDPVIGDAQAGAALPPPLGYALARDNANMATLPDGQSSVTNMYMWQPLAGAFYAPCVDGDFDMGVIGHEYAHMIENRMIGKGNRRSGHHAGAMGESTSDLLSIEQLNASGFVPTDGENPWATGTYATGNQLRGIRNYAGNFPRTGGFPQPGEYPEIDPLQLGAVGYDLTGPQVHADGEIWTATGFDIRRALAAKYDAAYPEDDAALQERCVNGVLPADACPGNRRWIQLQVDAFLLMPTAPSMLDARNAMLAADQMRFDGENQRELWLAFARRGMGVGAATTNGTGRAAGNESDTDPLPDFESPEHDAAVITFRALPQDGGRPVSARIYAGHYEARVSPVADTDPATDAPAGSPANNLDTVGRFAPGVYEFVIHAPGYGHTRFREQFSAGEQRTVTVRLAANWASSAQGAEATGDAVAVTSPTSVPPNGIVLSEEQVLGRLIDDTERTNWQAAATPSGAGWSVAGRQATVDLAGRDPQVIERVQVSAALGPVFDPLARPNPGDQGQNRFTAVRAFEVWSCNAYQSACRNGNGFSRVYTSPEDAFPADAPRPVQPALILREFDVPRTRATHLRIVALTNQCEGAPDYQGEQDADPFNATDCDAAGPTSTRFVRIAELQAFTRDSVVR